MTQVRQGAVGVEGVICVSMFVYMIEGYGAETTYVFCFLFFVFFLQFVRNICNIFYTMSEYYRASIRHLVCINMLVCNICACVCFCMCEI